MKGGCLLKKVIQVASIIFLVLMDILFMPWLLSIVIYYLKNFKEGFFVAYNLWLSAFSPLYSVNLFKDLSLLKLWGVFQILFLVFLYHVMFDRPGKRKNKVTSDIGGPESTGGGEHGTSRWMTEKETSEVFEEWDTDTEIKKSGSILGLKSLPNKKFRVVYDSDDKHTLIIATSRAGKTRRLIIPKIWMNAKAGESMVIADIKKELYKKNYNYLKRRGYKIVLIDFRNPAVSNKYNPMYLVNRSLAKGDYSKATEAAWDIANSIVDKKSHPGDPLWPNGEESTIASLILTTAYECEDESLKHMGSVYSLFYKLGVPDEEGRIPLIEYINSLPDNHPGRAAFATAAIAPYRTRASFFSSASSDLRLWSMPSIMHMTSEQDHNLEDVGKEKTAVFLVIPDEKSTTHFLATLYITQTYQALVDLANRNGGRLPVRVNFELDEFGNLPSIPDFPNKITVAAGRGIRFTLVVQDLSQIEELYGKLARTIQGNCHLWLYLLTTDLETAKYISQKTGEYTIASESTNSSVRSMKEYSVGSSEGTTGRYLLTPNEVLRWPADQVLVMAARQHPVRLPLPDLSKWPADVELDMYDDDEDFNVTVPMTVTWTPKFELKKEEEKEEEKPKPKRKPAAKKKPVTDENADVKTDKQDIKDDNKGTSTMDMID